MQTVPTMLKSRKGFSPKDPEIRKQIKTLMKASTTITLVTLALDWLTIFAWASISWFAFTKFGTTVVTLCLYLVSITLIASRQRALECLIHEAAHVNLSPNLKLNDCLAWIFAALPLGHNLKSERRSHLIGHHKNFWDEELDPDLRRYRQIGIDRLPAHSYIELSQILVTGFLPYIKGTIPAFFLPKGEELLVRLMRVTFWIAIVVIGNVMGILMPMILYWLVPFLAILTLIRYIGEASEHAALGCTDEFGSTRNNLGWFNEHFIHPHGDAYHLVHHLYPKVPFHKSAEAHRLLMNDPVYKTVRHRCGAFVLSRL